MEHTPPKKKILLVDDQPGSILVVQGMLQDEYELFFATNGADALVAVAINPPDLILLDIILPDMDGREVCTQLKADPKTQSIPIIFVTVKSSNLDEKVGLELGAADYVSKPVNATTLKLRIKNQLELKQHREQLELLVQQRTAELLQARDAARAREHEATEREQLLWTILETSLDAFIMINHQGKVIDFNPAAEKLFGHRRIDLLGCEIAEIIIPPELRSAHRLALQRTLGTTATHRHPIKRRVAVEGLRADGQRIDLEVAISSVLAHGRPVYTAFLRDLTGTKQLLVALNDSLAVAERSFRTKDLFLANMSHEIRTPMNGVLGMIDLALRATPAPPPQILHFLRQAKSSSRLLLQIINDILDFSKIEAGKITPCSLNKNGKTTNNFSCINNALDETPGIVLRDSYGQYQRFVRKSTWMHASTNVWYGNSQLLIPAKS